MSEYVWDKHPSPSKYPLINAGYNFSCKISVEGKVRNKDFCGKHPNLIKSSLNSTLLTQNLHLGTLKSKRIRDEEFKNFFKFI